MFVLLLLAYRAYSALSERHETLSRLYQFTQLIGASQGVDQVLVRVLEQACEVLRAEHAEIVLTDQSLHRLPERIRLDPAGRLCRERLPVDQLQDPLWRAVLTDRARLLLPRGCREPALKAFLDDRGMRDAILVPLVAEADVIGTMLVADRLGAVRTFDDEDARLLQTVADHAGIAVQNGLLVDQLRHEALHDGLTGLPNRTLLNRRLAELSEQVRGGGLIGLAVVILDLDRLQRGQRHPRAPDRRPGALRGEQPAGRRDAQRATWSPGWAATSSPSCCRGSSGRTTPAGWAGG